MAADRPVTDDEKRSLAAFAQAMPGPVLVVDVSMRMLAANAAARALLPALQPGDPLPRGLRAPQVLDAVRSVCAGGEPETVRWRERVPVEQVFDVSVARVALDGAFAVAIAMSDLSEAMRAERMRTDFVANASHELRTPLASLMGFIETLQGPAREDAAARVQFLAIMREQALRMSRLIDDLLSLSRIEQTVHLRPQDSVDIVAIVRHVAETLAPLAAESGAQVRLDAPEAAIAPGDRDELIRLAENLIENAIKYGGRDGERPRVDVAISREGAQWVLSVRDNGPGIAPEHIPRLTERFFRTDAGREPRQGRHGAGTCDREAYSRPPQGAARRRQQARRRRAVPRLPARRLSGSADPLRLAAFALALAAAILRRLVGHARVMHAVRGANVGTSAAIAEVGRRGIAQRPAAHAFAQLHDGHALRHRDDDVFDRTRRGRSEGLGLQRKGGAAAGHGRRGTWRGRPLRSRRGGAWTRRARGRRALDAAGEAEPMHLADDGVAGDAVRELRRDLAGAQAIHPQFAKEFDSFIGPGHESSSGSVPRIRLRRSAGATGDVERMGHSY